MRWKCKGVKVGTKRVVKRFLWLPTLLQDANWRWLETAYILQEYFWGYDVYWRDLRWATREEYEGARCGLVRRGR